VLGKCFVDATGFMQAYAQECLQNLSTSVFPKDSSGHTLLLFPGYAPAPEKPQTLKTGKRPRIGEAGLKALMLIKLICMILVP
jgi:hypothetical protein